MNLTIFSAPKPFRDPHIAAIQRNAIQSWRMLGPEVEILLIGDEDGMAEAAEEFGARHLPQVKTNDQGTPLVSSIFDLARQHSEGALLCYVNADIILLPGLAEQAANAFHQCPEFLLVGQRWDLDVTDALDFEPGWPQRMMDDVARRGRRHPPAGSDYFIFPRGLYTDIPDFAIGRAGWDNWMIYHAAGQPWPCIDGTPDIDIIHQNHDYRHLPGERPHYRQPETQANTALGGGARNMYLVLDSDRELRGGQVRRPRLTLLRFLRRVERALWPPDDKPGPRRGLARRVRRLRRRLGKDVE
ncbi:MAG: glycosyltransferase family 2 protein [Chloroflexi bacterium]|nr:glycosyltransferase family 2 protein [Chloroflexota bacterium]